MSFVAELERMADAARDLGFPVVAVSGWRTAGHGTTPTSCRAVMWHDTVTPASMSDARLRDLLRHGYDKLPGPIANAGLGRDGSLWLVAAGRAYHAGSGSWPGVRSGNLHTLGIEAANAGHGSGERWSDEQFACAAGVTAACGAAPVGHKEWAPSRKVDPWSVDMHRARDRVAGAGEREEDIVASIEELRQVVREESVDKLARERVNQAVRLAQGGVEGTIALHREILGLEQDPASDEVWSQRIREGGATVADAVEALRGKAGR